MDAEEIIKAALPNATRSVLPNGTVVFDVAKEYPKMDECRICGSEFMATRSVDFCSNSCAAEKYGEK